MVAILGFLVTFIVAVIWYLLLLILFVVLLVIQARRERAKRPKRPKRPKPLKPIVKTLPIAKPPATPQYIRRWGMYRQYSVAAEKAQWEADFDRVAPPGATAPKWDRQFIPPSAPPPAPKTPDEVFTGLRKRLADLA